VAGGPLSGPANNDKLSLFVFLHALVYVNTPMYYTYVLHSEKDGKLYTGYSPDLKNRMQEHKNGECISTAKRRPLNLEGYIAVPTEMQARSLERYFKTGSGTSVLKKRVLQSE